MSYSDQATQVMFDKLEAQILNNKFLAELVDDIFEQFDPDETGLMSFDDITVVSKP